MTYLTRHVTDEDLYWNEIRGWVDRDRADRYTQRDRDTLTPPPDGQWESPEWGERLVLYAGRWHIARPGIFTMDLREFVALTGNNPTVMAAAKPEERPEGKIEAVGWCEGNQGTLICPLGQEEEIKDLPESKNAPR